MCSFHSTRENDKLLAKDRLHQELLQSGSVTDTSDLGGITLDLSFLDIDYSINNNQGNVSNKQSTSSKDSNLFELSDDKELPTKNYLLD